MRELQALHYDGEPKAEELKDMLRESHSFGGREITVVAGTEVLGYDGCYDSGTSSPRLHGYNPRLQDKTRKRKSALAE